MIQWHPIFAQLLRPAVEPYYDVQTTMPVGDAPREADFVLLRRTSSVPPPFRGLWRHLTVWNVFEFKGPTVSPRQDDLDRLIELGLGIDRRLQVERIDTGNKRLRPEPLSTERQVARLVFAQPGLQQLYGGWLATLHPAAWKEVEAMARTVGKKPLFDIRPAVESLGLDLVIQQVGLDRVVEQIGTKELVRRISLGDFLANLTPTQRRELRRRLRSINSAAVYFRLLGSLRPSCQDFPNHLRTLDAG